MKDVSVTWLGPSWWAPGGGRGCAQGDVCPQGLSAPEGRTLPAQTVCSGPSPWGSGRGAPSSGRGWSLRLHILVFNPPAASSQRLPRKAAPREPPSGSPSFSRVTSEPPKPWREDLKTHPGKGLDLKQLIPPLQRVGPQGRVPSRSAGRAWQPPVPVAPRKEDFK